MSIRFHIYIYIYICVCVGPMNEQIGGQTFTICTFMSELECVLGRVIPP